MENCLQKKLKDKLACCDTLNLENCINKDCPAGPRGLVGATGPIGPVGNTPIIESILVDNDRIQSVLSNSLINLGVVINQTGSSMTFSAPSTVTISAGTYLILFEVLVSNTSSSGDAGASMLVNGVVASNAAEYLPATRIQSQIVLQHNITVTSNTTIQILNASNVSNNYHDASLSILKIG